MAHTIPTTARILRAAGETFSAQAGFTILDKPAPLFQLLVLCALLAKPIDSGMAADAARELRKAGVTTPHRARTTTWQERVDALGRARYRRFDESMATRVDEIAAFLIDTYHADARALAVTGDVDATRARLLEVPGIGPTGADIFLREAQQVWHWLVPFLDDRVLAGARRLGLSDRPSALRRRFTTANAAALATALVRADLDDELVERLTGTGGDG